MSAWIAGRRRGRVNPLIPALVGVLGLAVFLAGSRWVGGGVAIGAVLAYVNGLILSRRVDLASATGDMAGAMLVMQGGLLVTFVVVGAVTVLLVKISVALAVAAAVGFAVTHLAILAAFYWSHGRAAARAAQTETQVP